MYIRTKFYVVTNWLNQYFKYLIKWLMKDNFQSSLILQWLYVLEYITFIHFNIMIEFNHIISHIVYKIVCIFLHSFPVNKLLFKDRFQQIIPVILSYISLVNIYIQTKIRNILRNVVCLFVYFPKKMDNLCLSIIEQRTSKNNVYKVYPHTIPWMNVRILDDPK